MIPSKPKVQKMKKSKSKKYLLVFLALVATQGCSEQQPLVLDWHVDFDNARSKVIETYNLTENLVSLVDIDTVSGTLVTYYWLENGSHSKCNSFTFFVEDTEANLIQNIAILFKRYRIHFTPLTNDELHSGLFCESPEIHNKDIRSILEEKNSINESICQVNDEEFLVFRKVKGVVGVLTGPFELYSRFQPKFNARYSSKGFENQFYEYSWKELLNIESINDSSNGFNLVEEFECSYSHH